MANNTRARARLVLTEIVRYKITEKTGLDLVDFRKSEFVAGEEKLDVVTEETEDELSLFDLLPSWSGDPAEEEVMPGEEPLELFYLASFLLLVCLAVTVLSRSLAVSRRRAALLNTIRCLLCSRNSSGLVNY